jgi:hypothetical protein
MAANANSDLSTITSPAGAVPDEIPVVEVEGVNATVKVKWGTLGSQQTTVGLDASYTDTFHATDSTGVEPLVKTYGTLLGCNIWWYPYHSSDKIWHSGNPEAAASK